MLSTPIKALLVLPLVAGIAAAQDGYRQPPDPIPQILDALPTPAVSVGPDRERLLLLDRRALPEIAEIAGPELRLAGLRIDPTVSGRTRMPGFTGLRLRSINGGGERRITTPDGARIESPQWSPDGRHIAFAVTMPDDSAIVPWVADAGSGAARALGRVRLNATLGTPCRWMGNARLLCRLVPVSRGVEPPSPRTPRGPVIQESEGRAAPNRTYQDLLQSPHDEALFAHYASSQLAIVGLDGSVERLGEPAIHLTAEPSPDGRFILVEMIERPFSYLVPVWRFPKRIRILDPRGAVVKELATVPLQEEVPVSFDAVPTGPRDVEWRADAPATVVWVEALDGGDPATAAEKRDRVRMLAAPFSAAPTTLIDLEYRLGGIEWGRDDLAIVEEDWRKNRRTRSWIVNPGAPGTGARVLFDRSSEDRYGDPGRFVTKPNDHGHRVLRLLDDGRTAYLEGSGASAEGDRPFLDRMDLRTGARRRLWRSAPPHYEEVVALLDDRASRILTQRESVTEPSNYYVRDLRRGRVTRLTDFKDPAPQFAGVKKELIRYKRADGVDLTATLYLPPNYDPAQGPLPFLLWAYPREFKSADAASQVIGSPHRFTRPAASSHLFVLTQGYAVLDGPTMPIIGEGDREPNDTYVEQLVASAQAAVDKIVEMGVADRERIAIGGHSYGAFMAANLLAHSDIFRAGIARSGAYNRTLTPFGFQAEERTFWDAPDVYLAMSPFTNAHRINEPVLLIHGMADNNSGTFPIQSERLYAALKGTGGKARLVFLPAESHGYAARQSVGHVLWEMVNWLDRYVKEKSPQVSDR